MRDYYKILGIVKNSSQEDIKRAYRKLAHQYHPDKKGGDEKKFKEINEAYQVLGNEEKRQQYDQFGRTFDGAGGAQGPYGFGGFSSHGGFSAQGGPASGWGADVGADLGDIFEEFFSGFGGFSTQGGPASGWGTRQRTRDRGSDIAVAIDVPFVDSVFGGKRTLVIEKTTRCAHCGGNGAEPGSALRQCNTCQGSGTVREMRRSIIGSFTTLSECTICGGIGKIPEKKCSVCRGAGILRKNETIEIEIPPGIRDGEAIKLTGQGEAAPRGGTAGDLYVKIHVLRHPIFHREGNDLTMDLMVPLTELVRGGEQIIETLDGKIQLKIPELSQAGDILRVRGKGILRHTSSLRQSISGQARGDLLIKLKQRLPKKLSPRARKLLEDLGGEGL